MYIVDPPLPAVIQDSLARIVHARKRYPEMSPELSDSLDTVEEGLRTTLTLIKSEGWGDE